MKKRISKVILCVILAVALFFVYLCASYNIGKTANNLEKDIRHSQKIAEDWRVEGSVSDSIAAFISYPQDKSDHTFSVYVNRPGLSFGYFFRGGGHIAGVDGCITEYVLEGYNERAFISINTQKVDRVEIAEGNELGVIDIESSKPFAIILPTNAGRINFYDIDGNVVEYVRETL